MTEKTLAGLWIGDAATPLEAVAITARLNGTASLVEVRQRFHNRLTQPLEALYVFPLEEGAAIVAFEATIGDVVVRAALKPREEAFAAYDAAMSEGHGAYLLEQQRANRFSASLGNIQPGAVVEIMVRYVAQLQHDRDGLRFMLPTTLTPRYQPQSTPADEVTPLFAATTSYRLQISIVLDGAAQIEQVASPSHPIAVHNDGSTLTVTFGSDAVHLDRDVVLRITPRQAAQTAVLRARAADGSETLMVTFQPQLGDLRPSTARELIYVIDCSGSMSGESIQSAVRALSLCLRSMRVGDSFNICRFGSNYDLLWPTPQPYSEATLNQALALLKQTDADLGGTEILAPLRAITAQPLSSAVAGRDVIILTDGAVSNEDEVLQLVRAHAGTTRIFSFGIGIASDLLVRGLARNSGGAAEFIGYGERIEPAVLRTFGRLNDARLANVQLDWNGLQVEAAPATVPALFAGDLITVFARVSAGSADRITLRAGEASWPISVPSQAVPDTDNLIATLWARALLRDLEEGSGAVSGSNQRRRTAALDKRKQRMVALSLRYGLLCGETAFIAVEERRAGERTTTQSVLIQVPNELPADGERLVASPLMARALAAPQSRRKRSSPMHYNSPPVYSLHESSPTDTYDRLIAGGPTAGTPELPEAAAADAVSNDTLFALLLTQRFDGSFPLDAVRAAWPDHSAHLQQLADLYGNDLAATVLAVIYCREQQSARGDEWRAAVEKAEAWLLTQPTAAAVQAAFSAILHP